MSLQTYIYVLTLTRPEGAWAPTDEERAIVSEHYYRLESLHAEKIVSYVGRTTTNNPMGIVVFEAETEEAARQLMEGDPAVQKGVMRAEVYPFRIAFK
jgi:uncharacterized protein YciI